MSAHDGLAELRQATAVLKRPPVHKVRAVARDASGRIEKLVEGFEVSVDLQAIVDTGIALTKALNDRVREMSREDALEYYAAVADFAATIGRLGATGNAPELAQTWTDEAERVVKMLTDAGYEVKGWPAADAKEAA